jgi:hypothetical protein
MANVLMGRSDAHRHKNLALGTPISAHEIQDVLYGQKQNPDEHHRARCFERDHGALGDDPL